ncbi:bifunctional diaminohydroxyphosphoribosylaminopyrimidine deaminase/5-amino-6-(5-phosphoribosylamino)uracil reductase RibD [Curvivirga sp.]|uniref:bifunctional diaminohydroxyphosphoribosylaminopyrimidine deaminase/5-amino-6-(5-phosphoribosylamino)uracil reductase RibD n=1 Tax=Curvivirga sp. TaxID=2856848 RepID=UPI003B5B017E
MTFSQQDKHHMKTALDLSRRGLGNVWPNPAVGCVIVNTDGQVISRGWTQPSGRPHAEAVALAQAGRAAEGATAYVTLEPCSHYGKTPPCAKSLIDAKVSRVVIATSDPDPRVSGAGVKMLQEAGIQVDEGLFKEEADEINAGFFNRITKKRPYITLKVATTLDGYIASVTGHSKWITGPSARMRGHLLRSQNDAILVGAGTAIADDPSLNTRFVGAGDVDQPVRIVLDSKLGLKGQRPKLLEIANAESPVWLINSVEVEEQLSDFVSIVPTHAMKDGRIDVVSAAETIADQGITRLLIEGGGQVAASFLKAGLVDQIYWFRAPSIIGGDGLPAIASLKIEDLIDMPRFELWSTQQCGEDHLTILKNK